MDDRTFDGLRHLACFTADGRELLPAAYAFIQAGDRARLADCLRIAKRFGLFRPVLMIRGAARAKGWPELDMSEADFRRWFRERAALWFDIHVDRFREVAFIDPADLTSLYNIGYTGPSFDHKQMWRGVHGRIKDDPNVSAHRKELILHIAEGRAGDPVARLHPDPRRDVAGRFETFCRMNGVTPLRILQQGRTGLDRRSWVWLALDRDGIAKVFKEIIPRVDDRLGPRPGEDEIYARLGRQDFTPVWYGLEESEGLRLGRQSVCHGQTLSDLLRHGPLPHDQAVAVAARLARILYVLHAKGILYLDLRPENVVIHDDEVRLLDFDGSRLLAEQGTHVEATPQDAAYVPPETLLKHEASRASDVFQLGVLWYVMLTGAHPFAGKLPAGESRIEQLGTWSLANATVAFDLEIEGITNDFRLGVMHAMLDKDPSKRPGAEEVFKLLEGARPLAEHRPRLAGPRDRKAALLPARMGLPHKGHIEYMTRVLELGYRLVVSLQRSWTITDRDPYPKHDVMKMVAHSLFERGFGPDDMRFVFTPFTETAEQMRMHFAMMPGIEDIAVVASGNPDIPALFAGFPILDQRAVFGAEDEDYEDRSWGESLRAAIREGDRFRFDQYAASGVEKVMSFDELRERYARDPVDFVRGSVIIEIDGEKGERLADGAWLRYTTPAESVVRILASRGITTTILDPYAREERLLCWGSPMRLRYERSTLDAVGNLHVRFTLLHG